MGDFSKAKGAGTTQDSAAQTNASQTDAVLARLARLHEGFTAAAEDNRKKADDIAAAMRQLEEKKRGDTAQHAARFRRRSELQSAFIKGLMAHEKKPHAFTVFIDHTGSITERPLNAALDAAGVLQAAGAKTALWGSYDEIRWIKGDVLDPALRATFDKKGASGDFRPVADEMIKSAALARANNTAPHFIVIGDGEFADYSKAKTQLEKLFKSYPRATLDIVILGRAGTGMEFLSEQLQKDFPGKIAHHLVNGPAYWQGTEEDLSTAAQSAIAKIAESRINPAKKPKAPQAPKGQKPETSSQ